MFDAARRGRSCCQSIAATLPGPARRALYALAARLFQVCFGAQPRRRRQSAGRAATSRTKALWRGVSRYTLCLAKNRRPPAGRRARQDVATLSPHDRRHCLPLRRARAPDDADRRNPKPSPDEIRHGRYSIVPRRHEFRRGRLPCTRDRAAGRISRGRGSAPRSYARMAKRMLIDATHPEETRVVVLNGNRLEEFDFELSTKQQVKGNIYLAKVTRVEPSLQAAFVEYGGNRHGFLAFSEIHPDYFRIPVGDREAGVAGGRDADAEALEAVIGGFGRSRGAARDGASGAGGGHRGAAGRRGRTPTAANPLESVLDRRGDEPRRSTGSSEAEDRAEAARCRAPWHERRPVPALHAGPLRTLPEPGGGCRRPRERGCRMRRPMSRAGSRSTIGEPSAHDDASRCAREETSLAAEDGRAADGARPWRGRSGEAEVIETLGGDEFEEAERQRSARPAPLQDPGGGQAPADHAGPGHQGGARQQGRGADDLSVARRTLLRADAQHRRAAAACRARSPASATAAG